MTTAPDTPARFDETSPSVQAHLSIIQSVIQRMAANSSACKTWCVTIVSAILVVIADKNRPGLVFVAMFPTVLFGALDIYYLGLEKGFRASYESFVRKVHDGSLVPSDLYTVAPASDTNRHQSEAFKSFSVWGFYLALVALAALVYIVAPLLATKAS